MANYYYSGQGSLYVGDRDVNGRPTGLRAVGNVPTLELSIDITKLDHKESETGNRSIDLTLVQELKGTFNMVLESISTDNLALAFFGAASTVTGAAVVNEAVTLRALVAGEVRRVPLANIKLNDAIAAVLTDSLSGLRVINTDYAIDYDRGEVWALAGWGGPSLPDTGQIDYTFLTYKKTAAFTLTNVTKYLRFDGINTVDGELVIVDIFKAQFDPAQSLPLINDEVAQLTVTGSMLQDTLNHGLGSDFFIERRTA